MQPVVAAVSSLSPRSSRMYVYTGLVVTQLIYGIWPILAKTATNAGTHPLVFATYRCGFSAVVLLLASRFLEGPQTVAKKSFGILPAHLPPWAELGVLGLLMAGIIAGFMVGVSLTSSVQAALLQPLMPCLTASLAVLLGLDRGSLQLFFGVGLAALGAGALVYVSEKEAKMLGPEADLKFMQRGTAPGDTLQQCEGDAAEESSRGLSPRLPHPSGVLWRCSLLGGVLFWLLLFPDEEQGRGGEPERGRSSRGVVSVWALEPVAIAALAYAVCLTSSLAKSLGAWANRRVGPSIVTVFNPLCPLLTTFFAAVLLGEFLNVAQMLGGAAILGGLLITLRAPRQNQGDHEEGEEVWQPLVPEKSGF